MKIFLDGVGLEELPQYKDNSLISGFTTNPSLLKKDPQLTSYKDYAKNFCNIINDKPVSFEIISDNSNEIVEEALEISSWSSNVNVKIPVVNSLGESNLATIEKLNNQSVKLNITAVFSQRQIKNISDIFKDSRNENIISIFAGRIADTGLDPIKFIKFGLDCTKENNIKILWASPREVLNIYQAEQSNCDIITVTTDLFKKYSNLANKDLEEYSQETSKMFYDDAKKVNLNVFK